MKRRLLLAATLCGAVVCGVLAVASGPASAQDETTATPDKSTATTTAVPEREVSNRIDEEVKKVWVRDKIKPSKQSSDEEFVRRVYLDTVGTPPTADEIIAFCGDKDKDKRRTLIAKLVDDPRFGRHISDLWTNILIGRGGRGGGGGDSSLFAIWLAERINRGDHFSDIIYDIVTAKGSVSENPAVAVYTRERPYKVPNTAGVLTKNLTGVQIQCAQCHDHPYEDAWTQDVFTGVASFFAGVNVRINNRSLPVDPVITDNAKSYRVPPSAMQKMKPDAKARVTDLQRYSKPVTLDGKAVLTQDRRFWRPAMAKWMVSPDNKQTARYIANRFWSYAFGIGLLNPVNDFNSFNEANHPELLEYLGQDLIDNKYDIKRLFRAILNSKTYQLSSAGPDPKAQRWHFASASVRQMTPEEFFGTFIEIAGGTDLARVMRRRKVSVSDQFKRRMQNRMKKMEKEKDNENSRDYSYDEDTVKRLEAWYEKMDDLWFMRRTMAQGYSRLSSDDEMNESEGFSQTIDQALLIMNGDVTNNLSGSRRGSVVWKLVNESRDDETRINRLYLTVLGRHPSGSEMSNMKAYVKESKNATAAYEDMMFALLASTEFATNH